MRRQIILLIVVIGLGGWADVVLGQIFRENQITLKGTLEAVYPGEVVVKDESGESRTFLIQESEAGGVPLTGRERGLRFPAKVSVTGEMKLADLQPGTEIRFDARLTRRGISKDTIETVWLASEKDLAQGITVKEGSETPSGSSLCEVVGSIDRIRNGRMTIKTAKSKFTSRTTFSFAVADDAVARMKGNDHHLAGPGAKVTRLVAWSFSTGDVIIEKMDLEVDGESMSQPKVDQKLLAKYRHLSDEPKKPRQVRSARFILQTDVSDRQAQIILAKLERMVPLLERYFGVRMNGIVTGFVVRDMSQWSPEAFPDQNGRIMILNRGGLCVSKSLGQRRQSMIYCTDDHGTVQHEATHAFCNQALGSAGPTWLAEGVAELGQYWKDSQRGVDIDPHVVRYLQRTVPKRKLLEIAIPGRQPAEQANWKDYAWRWALCHLLSNNPNYANRFKPLAIALMSERPGVSFASVYGPVAKEISFEYDFFIKHFDNGYRADLCAWQWKKKARPLRDTGYAKATVLARYGWQATSVQVTAGESYDVAGQGKWKISAEGTEYDANGDLKGRGRLEGAIFHDYQLDKPISLGTRASFTASSDGVLYLRCHDDWGKIADNEGELSVAIRRTPKK